MGSPSDRHHQHDVRALVELATRAPSVLNTQPWRWRSRGDTLELYADYSRQLRVADPDSRSLIVSCGCCLHHAQVAADALGFGCRVSRFPDPGVPDLVARITLARRTPSRHAAETLRLIAERRTDRRRFSTWPVPDSVLTHLAAHVSAWEARAVPLTDVTNRRHGEVLVNRATEAQRADERVVLEQKSWIDHSATDGIAQAGLPKPGELATRRPNRFTTGLVDDVGGREAEGCDGLVVLGGPGDDPDGWLRTGEGLSALWLAATAEGLSVVPVSQVVEVPVTRHALRAEVVGRSVHPHVLVRVGWQSTRRTPMPSSERRSLDDVLETSA